jgi:predicted MFS family arabinose efflux permease
MSAPATSFRSVLRVREFRALWIADLQSLLGDQLARVALSVLIFERTGSGFATATGYALTFLPALFGTPLGVLADRLPRRELLVLGDLSRAAIFALMAIPGLSLGIVIPLLVGAILIGSPWKAAESAFIADILAEEGYVLGSGLRLATGQAAQLAGFAVGGAAVAAFGPSATLAIDAATFALSALLLRVALVARPPAQSKDVAYNGWAAGLAVILRDRELRMLLGYAWLIGAFVVPEGIAAPYAAHLGGGAQSVGLLLASAPAGTLIGTLLFIRLVPADGRARLSPLLAVAAGLPLTACLSNPGLVLSMVLWGLTGVALAYQIQVMTTFVQATPAQSRGQAIAFASSGMLAAQGLGLIFGGLGTVFVAPTTVVAAAGAIGSAAAITLRTAQLHSMC